MSFNLGRTLLGAALCFTVLEAMAAPLRVEAIRIEGNRRVSAGTILNSLKVLEGDRIDLEAESSGIVKDLFALGLFDDVQLSRDGGELIVAVVERPAISEFTITGNKAIPKEQLDESLRSIGLVRGRLLNRATLETVEREIREVYFDQGYYGLNIDTNINEVGEGQVEVLVDVEEGAQARIRDVTIVGAHAFEEELLLEQFQLHPVKYNIFSRADRYTRAALQGDQDRLGNFYRNRGYLNFQIESTQVSLGEDERDIFITVHIKEGDKFDIGDIRIGGNYDMPTEELRQLVDLQPGDTFSRQRINESSRAIGERLGQDGFAFAKAEVDTREREAEAVVDLNLIVDAGQRFYVRRVEFVGNFTNRDEVFRRQMRIVEGSVFSPVLLRRSRERIQRLAFIDAVDIRTERVPGVEDQLDIVVNITEGRPGTFSASMGYGSSGAQFGVNLELHSAFGSGENLKLSFSRSDVTEKYSVSHTQPFFTTDGISQTLSAHHRKTDTDDYETTANWIANSWGVKASYGIPRTEYGTLRLGMGYDSIQIDSTEGTSQEIKDFLDENGDTFAGINAEIAYVHDTRDRFAFPRKGMYHRIGVDGNLASNDYPYYKLGYRTDGYVPLGGEFVFGVHARVDYGKGFGDFETQPFYDRFYAGGVGSVRGFNNQSLGPVDSNGDSSGGDFRVLGSLELLFPPPFGKRDENDPTPRRTRMSAFVDAGNVFATHDDFDADDLRLTYGLGLTWLAPVGPLKFSIAKPFEKEEDDDLESFQFEISF